MEVYIEGWWKATQRRHEYARKVCNQFAAHKRMHIIQYERRSSALELLMKGFYSNSANILFFKLEHTSKGY